MRWMRWRRRADGGDASATPEELRDERLSRYLDDDLAAEERSALEAELAADPGLREALDGLREVREALVALGEVRAPRSFALTAAPVSAPPRRPWLETATRIATGLAALLFVAALVNPAGNGEMQTVDRADEGAEVFGAGALPEETPVLREAAPSSPAAPGVTTGDTSADDGSGEGATERSGAASAPPAGEEAAPDEPDEPGEPGTVEQVAAPTEPAEAARPEVMALEEPDAAASGGPGGVVPALGVLVVLLGALSALLWWERRTAEARG